MFLLYPDNYNLLSIINECFSVKKVDEMAATWLEWVENRYPAIRQTPEEV